MQYLLWTVAGDRLLQLYRHLKSMALPALMFPSAAKLVDVAQLSTQRQDWESALTAAQDVAATDMQVAARLVNEIIGAIQRCGSNISVAVAALPLLHAADEAESVVKVVAADRLVVQVAIVALLCCPQKASRR